MEYEKQRKVRNIGANPEKSVASGSMSVFESDVFAIARQTFPALVLGGAVVPQVELPRLWG